MRRLDWQLVRPRKDGGSKDSLRQAEMIRRLVSREARAELSAEDATVLDELETSYEEDTISTCEAVSAPVVGDDPDWESRAVDEYADLDTDLELEEYLALRQGEPDCERCPYASPYSLHPMNPCEFAAGALEFVLVDRDLVRAAARGMDPAAMRTFADLLEKALEEGRWREIEELGAKDYLEKAIHFLRFWADQGFGILPTDIDDVLDFSNEPPPAAGADEEDGEPTIYH